MSLNKIFVRCNARIEILTAINYDATLEKLENAYKSYPVARRGVKKIAKTGENEYCKLPQQAPEGCSASDIVET